ncbi:MAG: glycoside hydrolase family 127 protein [Clostridia bacterium]|nr:glycoside hydrolase family 127 protein [Clostridia bacterium]
MNRSEFTRPVDAKNVVIRDSFFKDLMEKAAHKIIPYQWKALNDQVEGASPSFCIHNFKAAAGLIQAQHGGFVFQDSDLAKWIEAASHMLIWKRDEETEKNIDETVDLIEKAQLPDGYINTYYSLNGIDKRWTNLRDNHELYCAGHMLEAAVAYYKATGKRKLMDIMIRFVQHIADKFGTEEGKEKGYPGHEEIELALVKLYVVTKDPAHLALAKYFIDERGQQPNYFVVEADREKRGYGWARSVYEDNAYYQADKPVRAQTKANGHSVRANYLFSGMADVARECEDEELYKACETLWKNITRKQMYITGQVGQSSFGEAYSFDYDLPNDLVYGETCASIALMFFAHRMLRLSPKGEYGDIMDKLIYNGTVSGMSLTGDRFFYVNPLESWPERNRRNQQFAHVKNERQKWFPCACCPPNLARLISSLPGYVLHTRDNTVFFALYTSSEASFDLPGGKASVSVETEYPWNGRVLVNVKQGFDGMTLALRLPVWCKQYTLEINSQYAETVMKDGYLYITRPWQAGDKIEFVMDMPVMVMRAHPLARANAGKVAVQRGPVVYCLEEFDNGRNLNLIKLPKNAAFAIENDEALGNIPVLSSSAVRETNEGWDEYELYADRHEPKTAPIRARFIPYYAWNNRGVGEMCVWVREDR